MISCLFLQANKGAQLGIRLLGHRNDPGFWENPWLWVIIVICIIGVIVYKCSDKK